MVKKYSFAISVLLSNVLVVSALQAEEFSVQAKANYLKAFDLNNATAFVVESENGDILVREIRGDHVELSVKNEGTVDAKLIYEERSAGQVKIKIEFPNERGQSRGGGINIVSGNNVVISGGRISGRVVINGVDMTAGIGGAGPVHLEIGIPTQFLAHLKAKTAQGDVSLDGLFDGPLKANRQVELNSSQGSISCSNLSALGGVSLKTSQGDIEVQLVKGAVDAKSSQGNVTANGVGGDLDLKTSQGEVRATENIGSIRAKSSQGNITIKGQSGGTVWARTSMGDIKLNNPEANDEDVKTDMGNVRGLTDRSNAKNCGKDLLEPAKKSPFDF